MAHQFGGDWTTDKLDRIRRYLMEYTRIFQSNERARRLFTTYVDAFAGTGYRTLVASPEHQPELWSDMLEPDAEGLLKGSARIALEVNPPFKRYLFIERDHGRAAQLRTLALEFSDRADRVDVQIAETNAYLKSWCKYTDWRRNRAVVFLDPYGMEVDWSLIEAIALTQAIDLWLLFPLGVAVIRLLTKREPPPAGWAQALTRTFGTDEWQKVFYSKTATSTLFGEEDRWERNASLEAVGRFFVQRLSTVFAGVADNPLPLLNSKNMPLYLLCFAAGNPKGAPTAIRIAQHILRR